MLTILYKHNNISQRTDVFLDRKENEFLILKSLKKYQNIHSVTSRFNISLKIQLFLFL